MKKNKSSAVMEMLKKGLSVKQIKERIAVSESYIYLAKKKLAEAGLAAAEAAEEAVNETLHNITQGRQKYREAVKAKAGEYIVVEGAKNAQEVDAILNARGSNYGSFLGLSQVTQRLKAVAHQFAGQNNKTFDADQAEALDLIFTKIGRILNGDPNHIDSWIDIAGYATLVADRLQGKTR
jgi:predicted transcriptional regulator